MKWRELAEALDRTESSISSNPWTVSPTSFDPNDRELRAFPRPLTWRWDSAERALREFRSRGILLRLPLFWQVEPALFRAGQAAGAPLFVSDQENMPVGAAAVRDASMDTVVTDSADAAAFSSYLSGAQARFPRAWIIVHPLPFDAWTLPAPLLSQGALVAQEVHLFPGVVVLEQCPQLMARKEALFHASERYSVRAGSSASVTSAADPLPLQDYELDLPLTETGRCGCGKTILSR